MKRMLHVFTLGAFFFVSQVLTGEEKCVWIFPTISYMQSIDEYRLPFDFSSERKIKYYSTVTEGAKDFPFIAADENYFYFREGYPRLRIAKDSIQTGADCFQTYYDGAQQVAAILGGGYYASSRIPNKNFVATFKQLSEARSYLLAGKLQSVHGDLIDTSFILPQVIRCVKLSAPFLEETIQGIRYSYDDDIILYRWFYTYLSRGNVAMYFINDPTPMVEGAPGNGVGMTLDIDYHIPTDNLVVLNGFVDLERKHLYKLNARMKKVRVQGEDFDLEYEFQDYVHFAQIDFPKKVRQVRLTVLEVYDGSRYEDLCISGLFTNPDVLNTRNSPLAYELLEEAKKEWMEKK